MAKGFIPKLPEYCPYCGSQEVHKSGMCIFAPYPAWKCNNCNGIFFVNTEESNG